MSLTVKLTVGVVGSRGSAHPQARRVLEAAGRAVGARSGAGQVRALHPRGWTLRHGLHPEQDANDTNSQG